MPEDVLVPKYAKPFAESMTAERRPFSPLAKVKVSAPTRVKSESWILTTMPGDVSVPKYAKVFPESMTAERREFSPIAKVSAPTRVKSERRILTTMPGDRSEERRV